MLNYRRLICLLCDWDGPPIENPWGFDPERDTFDACWWFLSREGRCDEGGGAEWRRARWAWILAGHPTPITGFILAYVNGHHPNRKG